MDDCLQPPLGNFLTLASNQVGLPLNLSISISGGKETNKDSPSSGERSGKELKFVIWRPQGVRVVIYRDVFRAGPCQVPWNRVSKRVTIRT